MHSLYGFEIWKDLLLRSWLNCCLDCFNWLGPFMLQCKLSGPRFIIKSCGLELNVSIESSRLGLDMFPLELLLC
jgi:hypothetical protein